MLLIKKAKGQRLRSKKPNSLAFISVASWQSGLMRPAYDWVNGDLTTVPSVRIGHSPQLNYAPSVVEATSGAILGREPKDRVVGPTVIVALRLKESKSENDLPQLRNENGESWKVR
jgi:hypothetical protein